MLNIVKAEYQKTKNSMSRRLIWAFPLLTFIAAFVLTAGMKNAYAESVWNWWYTLLSPGMIALICHFSMKQEKKTNYYSLMTLSTDKRKLMLGKILYMSGMILVSDVLIFAGASLGGNLLTTNVPFRGAMAAVLVLTVTQLWEIPVFLFLSERFGMIPELLLSLFLSVGGTILSQTGKWFLFVFAIPMRTLTPLIHVLPNGIGAADENPSLDMRVVLPGICLSVMWFILTTFLFVNWFDRREVK